MMQTKCGKDSYSSWRSSPSPSVRSFLPVLQHQALGSTLGLPRYLVHHLHFSKNSQGTPPPKHDPKLTGSSADTACLAA